MGRRKRYTAEEKVGILREILEEEKPLSQIADKYRINPINILNWRKQLFEEGIEAFRQKRSDISSKAEDRKVALLEEKIKHKDEVIAELAEELLELKKKNSGHMQESPR